MAPLDDPYRPWLPPHMPTPQPVGFKAWAKLVATILRELFKKK
jgi:hypothetical protein